MALDKWRIESLPESTYYIRDFITEEEEEGLLNKVSLTLLHGNALCPPRSLFPQLGISSPNIKGIVYCDGKAPLPEILI